MRKTVLMLFLLICGYSVSSEESHTARFAAMLDSLASAHYEDQLQAAFGTFTFEYSELATPFSRWLEDELIKAVPAAKRVRLFNRSAAAAMDPAFRELYKDFFASNQVDALLSGRYFPEGSEVRVRLDLTSLRNGNLIGSGEFRVPAGEIPRAVAVAPDGAAESTAKALSGLFGKGPDSASSRLEALVVSLSTGRGPGGAYRDGEKLTVTATVNQDAYLKLYHVDVNGAAKLIWPNRFGGGDGLLRAGAAVSIPAGGDPFEFVLGSPYGTEFIKAIASTVPFQQREADFQDLGGEARGAITRGMGLGRKPDGASGPKLAEALASYVILPK